MTEIVALANEKFSTISQRFCMLRTEGLIVRRRQRNHLICSLADRHVADLIQNALAHVLELDGTPAQTSQEDTAEGRGEESAQRGNIVCVGLMD